MRTSICCAIFCGATGAIGGAVVTDWGGSNDHALGVRAGSVLEMPAAGGDSVRELMRALEDGKIRMTEVDARAEELLELVFSTGGPGAETDAARRNLTGNSTGNSAWDSIRERHHALAYRAAAESLTLLKNEDALLPFAAGTKAALIGDFAAVPRYQGAGSSLVNVEQPENLLDKIKDSGLRPAGYAKGFERFGKRNERLKQEAVELARQAEAVIVCLGLAEIQESEGMDRPDMKLMPGQIEILEAVAEANPKVAVVLFAGGAVETGWRKSCKALLYAGLGGQAGAGAVADALTGKINPCGKLAETWPEAYEDTPARKNFGSYGRSVEYREGIYVGYRYYQKAGIRVAFPFGFGLSYTKFAYSGLQAQRDRVTVTVTNTGERSGTEIVQLYATGPEGSVFFPARELKGFARVKLQSGESRQVTIPLDDKAFRYWNVKTNRWETEGGTWLLGVGASCGDIRLTASLEVTGTGAPGPYPDGTLPHYASGQIKNVSGEEFALLLGRPALQEKSRIDRRMTLGEMQHARSPLGWLIWGILHLLLKRSLKRGRPDLNLLFIYNMPLRGLARMTGARSAWEWWTESLWN